MKEINKQNITLKAFAIDQFGALGPQANNYLFNTKNTSTIKDDKMISRFTKPGLIAYKRNIEDMEFINLFKQPNDGWNLKQKITGSEIHTKPHAHQHGLLFF